ncbi:hypothetical protein [uncultured Enterococcus sp.]|uniref:DUF7448 domain-containing protein n=1 Tax=uncultured Enterococcus sp. TaxID=167972 RepID=UPI002045796C|nr:hypothetical protein [uncultured Enterococcus sp.]DAL95812.1 MAG TPA: hypothetical protein [Caudoviricetes sp.]
MDYHKDTIEKLKEKILMKQVKSMSEESLVLDDGTKIHFECTDSDCCASADGEWKSAEVAGLITDVQLVDVKKEEEEWGETQMVAKLVVLHDQNPVAQAQLRADNGNGDYYFSILSVFVDDEEIGKILESYYD